MNTSWQDEKRKAYFQRTCPSAVRNLLRVAWLGFTAVLLIAGCAAVRENTRPEVGQAQAKLDGQNVVVAYFKDVRRVQQAASDVCWAASLEQALAFQGVDTDQTRILEQVYSQADATTDRTINMFWWRQGLSIIKERLRDGAEVWIRLDWDGGPTPIVSNRTFVRKIARELDQFRIPLVGILTEPGVGHVVTVIGFAIPIEVHGVKRITPDDIVGFLIYDPLTAAPRLVSAEDLFKTATGLIYATIFNSATGAASGELSTTLYNY